jgi:hypothetical protein
MPDASAGIFTGLYWVATGKTPLDELQDDEPEILEGEPGDNARPMQPEGQGWGSRPGEWNW